MYNYKLLVLYVGMYINMNICVMLYYNIHSYTLHTYISKENIVHRILKLLSRTTL